MSDKQWTEAYAIDGDEADFEVVRREVEPGVTFSADAMTALHEQLMLFVGTRVARRWNQTGEPPTALRVRVQVKVQ